MVAVWLERCHVNESAQEIEADVVHEKEKVDRISLLSEDEEGDMAALSTPVKKARPAQSIKVKKDRSYSRILLLSIVLISSYFTSLYLDTIKVSRDYGSFECEN